MNERVTITVPWDVARTDQNTLRRLKPIYQAGRIRTARNAGFRAWLDAGRPRFAQKVRVSVLVRRGRRLDEMNAIGACKAVCDGLFVGRKVGQSFVHAMLPDDSPQWLEFGELTQETGKRWAGGKAEVVFTVEPVGEDRPTP